MPGNVFKKMIIAVFISVFVAGCSHHKGLTKIKPEPERSAYSWYNDAMQELVNRDYGKAAHSFTLLFILKKVNTALQKPHSRSFSSDTRAIN